MTRLNMMRELMRATQPNGSRFMRTTFVRVKMDNAVVVAALSVKA